MYIPFSAIENAEALFTKKSYPCEALQVNHVSVITNEDLSLTKNSCPNGVL